MRKEPLNFIFLFFTDAKVVIILLDFVHLHRFNCKVLRIYLIGYMGSGKSALGRQLAALLGTDFLDLDDLFEERYHLSIYDFFEKYGEDNFRKIESELLFGTSDIENVVISTGGGTPCFFDNMDFIVGHGISVYLRMTSRELAGRLMHVRRKRPLLKNLEPDKFEEWITEQLRVREVFYMKASHLYYPQKEDITELAFRLR